MDGRGYWRRAWWLACIVCCGLWGPAGAATPAAWRAGLDQARQLAENDVQRAGTAAAQLAAAVPAGATPAERARLLNVRARIAHYAGQTAAAGELADAALALAQQSGDRVGQAEAYLVLALNTVNQGAFERLSSVSIEAVKVLEGVDRPDLLGEAMLRLGMMYSRFGKPDEMVDACVRAMDLAHRNRNAWALAYGYYCLAQAYGSSDNNAQALQQYRLMQDQARRVGSRLLEGQAMRGMAQMLGAQDSPAAGTLARQASAVFRAVGAPFYLAASLFAEASQATVRGDQVQALALLDQVAAIYAGNPNDTGLWWTLTARSAAYLALKKDALAEQDLVQALALAEHLGLPLYLSESQRLLGALEARHGAYRKAYERSLEAAEMMARANRKKISSRVLELSERYQQEARQRQIGELTRRNEQQRVELREGALRQGWLWTVLGAIALVLAVLAFFLLRLRRSHRMLAAANGGLEHSQQALQRQTGILQSVLDSMGDGVAVADRQGRLVLVNPAAERIVGITRAGEGLAWPAGRRFYQADRSSGVPEHALPLARALQRGGAADASAELFMAGAGLPEAGRWLHMTARPLAGAQAGAVAVISDITERKRAEEEIRALNANLEDMVQQRTAQLRQQTRYLRVLIDTIPWWVWFKDTDSRYVAANVSAAQMMGVAVQQVPGKTDFDFHPAPVAQAFRDDDLKVMGNRRQQTVEELQAWPDGPQWVEVFKAPVLDEDGTVLGTVGLARDISARKEAEAARDAALLEAQRLAGMRSEFLARMSHELRTPLNAVLGFVQLLQRDGSLTPRQLASVDGIGHSGEHLLGLINDVLDSARLEASKLQLFPQRVETASLLDGIAAMVRLKAAERGLAFACEVGPGVPAALLVDDQRLRQVLLNLLSNAIKFTDQGVVRLMVTAPAAGRLRFAVQDSGVGIEPGQLETIFQPFEQVGEAQRRFGGTGLGLAISRQLVRLMGSEIQVESQPGMGSVFWFELEAAADAAGSAVLAELAPPAGAAPPPASVVPPPAAELAELMKLVRIGNMRAILAHTEHLERLDMRYRPFAEQLGKLARSYQTRALRQLIERYWPPDVA